MNEEKKIRGLEHKLLEIDSLSLNSPIFHDTSLEGIGSSQQIIAGNKSRFRRINKENAMNYKIKEKIKTISDQAYEEKLDRIEWNTILKERLTTEEFGLLKDDVAAGKLAMLTPMTQVMAEEAYPFMFTTFKLDNGKQSTPWYARVKLDGPTRPNDLLHLSKLGALVELDEEFITELF